MVLFFSTAMSFNTCRFLSWSSYRVLGDDVCRLAQFLGAQGFAFGGDYLGALFPLGLGLLGHGPLHAFSGSWIL